MQKKFNLFKMFLSTVCVSLLILSLGCSNASMISGALNNDMTLPESIADGETTVVLYLPDVGRGWDIDKYVLTASREGEEDKTYETKTGKVSLRLKIGTWKFSASALDSNGNVLYSAGASSSLSDSKKNAIYLQLIKRTATLRVKMTADILSVDDSVSMYTIKATRGEGFDDIKRNVYSINDSKTLQDLAMGKWDISCVAMDKTNNEFLTGSTSFDVSADNIGQVTTLTVELKMNKAPAPTFSIDSGKVDKGAKVIISSSAKDATVYARTDGKELSPEDYGQYGTSITYTIENDTTIDAITKIDGIEQSDKVTKVYKVVKDGEVADVYINGNNGTSSETITKKSIVQLSCTTAGALIYYTLDGSDPTTSSTTTLYKEEFPIEKTCTVKAVANKDGKMSSISTRAFTYVQSKTEMPTITPSSGTYIRGTEITITRNTDGATTYYTIGGGDPLTSEKRNSFTGEKVTIDTSDWGNGTYEIKAVSVVTGRIDSDIATSKIEFKSGVVEGDDNDSAVFKLVDNLIIGTEASTVYTKFKESTIAKDTERWYGFVHDAAGSVYIDVDPSDKFEIELYKNGQQSSQKMTVTNNIAKIEKGSNYYYLKLKATAVAENPKVRVYKQMGSKALESLEISATSTSVEKGKTLTLTATAQFSDGTKSNITPNWTVDKTTLATVSDNVLTAKTAGAVNISASYTYDGVTKTSNALSITITDTTPVEVTLTALSIEKAVNSSPTEPKFTATAYYSDGSTAKVTPSATWTSSNTSTATVSGGVVTLVAAGETKITASIDGKTSNEAVVTVNKVSDKIVIHVPVSLGYKYIWAWATSGSENYTGGTWPGKEMTINGDNYDYTIDKTATKVIFNSNSGSNVGTHQTNDLFIKEAGEYDYIGGKAGTKDQTGSSVNENFTKRSSGEFSTTITVGEADVPIITPTPVEPINGLYIFVKADSAPTIWAWQPEGLECTKLMGYTWNTQPKMKEATGLNDPTGWYMFNIDTEYYTADKPFSFILNSGSEVKTTKTATFWYDNGTYSDADPTTPLEPVVPTVKITPADGSTIALNRSISVTFTNGNDTITSAKVTVNGTENDMGTNPTTWTKSLADLGITTKGVSVSVSASVTNSAGTTNALVTLTTKEAAKEDTFTWDNVLCYFVLTDRFYNGDTANDASYYRTPKSKAGSTPTVALFHGGDIKGLTQKIDYFDNLGVNAIWITAPYEQAHGWVGGKNGAFPHYAFHGYYTLDWTAMDANMGTIEEFRQFVNACHSKGIRVVMDVVMNHVGYNNTEDMITYNYGYTDHKNHGWLATTDGKWDANDTVKWDNNLWESWFGPWISSFAYDRGAGVGGSCGGLPDVKTELTSSVGMAPVLVTKWGQDSSDAKTKYYNPSVSKVDWNGKSGDWRTDKGVAPADYQVMWLSAWVREVGIDGFRCDTAKHVEPFRWGELKKACQAALEAWRNDASKSKMYDGKDTGAADWDENFWMTGECWGWTAISGEGEYYTTGGFDSMINFSFNGGNSWDGNYRTNYPKESSWSSYLSINNNGDSDNNGNRNNVLTYISSHDTGLTRVDDNKAVGTGLILLPGGVQIYYGDESNRPKAYTGCGDGDMYTRGDMNWDNTATVEHWGKLGKFRKYNPAVGAGTGTAYKRSYSGAAGENKVAIGVSGTSVDVSGLFSDGTTVYNWYDGASATVSGGKVTFSGGSMTQPILVSDKNPASCGVTF